MPFDWTSRFEQERPYLFAVAYRMLGSASEADDILQEAWLRVRTSEEVPRNARAFLTTVVVRLCLDAAKSARARRETYVGPWLPEPLLDAPSSDDAHAGAPAEERVGIQESVSMALLVVLETLSPLERAAFLLREVFDYEFEEISLCLGRSEAACRQLFHRAKEHVLAKRSRFKPSAADADRLVHGFMLAVATGDLSSVESLLADDCVVTSDSGGRVSAARKPVIGKDHVAKFFVGLAKKAPPDLSLTFEHVNGQPAFVLRAFGRLNNVAVFEVVDGAIKRIRIVLNPEKLARFERALVARAP
ncbi:MAG: RNA polymerase sigma-70 factor [Polyangiaceae bacterium]|nr:RNA polymerase sigma-70 factor [Polyangiaceae bacterium]